MPSWNLNKPMKSAQQRAESARDAIWKQFTANGRTVTNAEVIEIILRETGLEGLVECERQRDELLRVFGHYHEHDHEVDGDACKACGLDLRHAIHYRAGDGRLNSKQ